MKETKETKKELTLEEKIKAAVQEAGKNFAALETNERAKVLSAVRKIKRGGR